MSNGNNWLVLLYLVLMEMALKPMLVTASYLHKSDFPCCDGILGYPGPKPFMPCSDLRCCNNSETVALKRVNHALGFCFMCTPKERVQTKCYRLGEEVATTNDTAMTYDMRTCCSGLKFQVIPHTNDVALVIKCVRR